jgi:deoxyribose-phosphate aldolase
MKVEDGRWDRVLACTDWTTLTFNESEEDMIRMMERAREMPVGPAAICMPMNWLEWWVDHGGSSSSILLATVLNFPSGALDIEAVAAEARNAKHAAEWDLVFPHESFRRGDAAPASELLSEAREWAGSRPLKVILETGAPWERKALIQAAELALDCGADFLKTSTGKTAIGATPEAVHLLTEVLRGTSGGLKLSGGIRTLETALNYMDQVAQALGDTFLQPATFRLGTSTLLTA